MEHDKELITMKQAATMDIDVKIQGVPYDACIDEQFAKEAIAALAYYLGKLSEQEACSIIGIKRRQFEETIIPKFGLSMIGGTQEDIDFETKGL